MGRVLDKAVLADSPILYWPLNDGSGTTAQDRSGNARDGTYVGSPTMGVLPGVVAASSAVRFDGSTQYVERADESALDFIGTAAFTLECWIRPTSVDTNNRRLIHKERNSPTRDGYGLRNQTGSVAIFRSIAGVIDSCQTTIGIASGTGSHHVAGTYDGANMLLYVDGVLVAGPTASAGSLVDTTVPLRFAADAVTTTNLYPGDGGAVAIYATALSAARIAEHYRAGLMPDNVGPYRITAVRRGFFDWSTPKFYDFMRFFTPSVTTATTAFKDAVARFRLVASGFKDGQARFRLNVRSYLDTQARFKVTARAYQDAQARFKINARAFADTAARFRLNVQGFKDAQARFKLWATSFKDAQARFRVNVRAFKDAQARYVLTARGYKDAAARFVLNARSYVDAKARFVLQVRAYKDTQARFRLLGSSWNNAQARFKVVPPFSTADAQARFRLWARSFLDSQARFKVTVQGFRDTQARFKVNARAFLDAKARFSLVVRAYKDAQARYRVIASATRDTQARFRLNARSFADSTARFVIALRAFKDAQGRFRLFGAGYGMSQARFLLASDVTSAPNGDSSKPYMDAWLRERRRRRRFLNELGLDLGV